jgi:hypothetical protein
MLHASEDERQHVETYFKSQAPDIQITFLQKVYQEAVLSHVHSIWDVHTDKDRWWVITNPANLYAQDQFPNMDLALTFHVGLCLRVPQQDKDEFVDLQAEPFTGPYSRPPSDPRTTSMTRPRMARSALRAIAAMTN